MTVSLAAVTASRRPSRRGKTPGLHVDQDLLRDARDGSTLRLEVGTPGAGRLRVVSASGWGGLISNGRVADARAGGRL